MYTYVIHAGAVTALRDHASAAAFTRGLRGALTVSEERDLPGTGSEELTAIARVLDPSWTKRVAVRTEVFELLEAKFPKPSAKPAAKRPTPNPPAEEVNTMSEAQVEAATAPKAAAKTAAKTTPKTKAATEKKARVGKGKPAGKPADFKQVMKGSKRGNILELLNGKMNAKQIGEKLGIPGTLVSSNVFCLHRDCGIGHSYGANGEITALYPAGKTLADALKVAAAPKAASTTAKKPKATSAAKAPKKGTKTDA